MKQVTELFINVKCPDCDCSLKSPRFLHKWVCPECGENLDYGDNLTQDMHPKKTNKVTDDEV